MAVEPLSEVRRTEPGRYVALEGDLLRLAGEVVHIGRRPEADVFIDDPTISRRHAVLVMRESHAVILDDRSLNGVLVNGERVSEAVLQDGDQIVLGRVELRYVDVAD